VRRAHPPPHISLDGLAVSTHWSCPQAPGCTDQRGDNFPETGGISTDSYSNVIICPHRFLKDDVVFNDAKRFLVSPEIEEEILVVPELAIPGGSVDFFLISRNTRSHKITDFVGIEFQALDTTGSIWGQRQLLISKYTTKVKAEKVKPCGFNWKMTAKTILVQLHHKVKTFESLGKKLVLVCQDHLIDYMYREFKFDMLSDTSSRNSSIVFHGYSLNSKGALCLTKELFGDSETLSRALGLASDHKVEFDQIAGSITEKIRVGSFRSINTAQ
jgi:hypothetical protein